MRKTLLLFISLSFFAQKSPKVDLDKYFAKIYFQNLPKHNVPFEKRTFNVFVTAGNYSSLPNQDNLQNSLNVYGWRRDSQNPSINLNLNLKSFQLTSTETQSRLVEEKNDKGVVTKSYILYQVIAKFNGSAVIGLNANFKIVDPLKEVKKEEAVASNRFLANAPASTATSASENFKKDYFFGREFTYTSKEFRSSRDAMNSFLLSKENLFNDYAIEFSDLVAKDASYDISNDFGFNTIQDNVKMWIIDSKEEEGQIQKEAIEAVKVIFANVKADVPLTEAEQNIKPLIDYFESLKTKYPDDNKGSRKIRYSAYYNLGKIYLYLDQPEKAIKEGEGLIANDYDTGDGKDIIKDANKLIDEFNKKGFKTRHNPSLR